MGMDRFAVFVDAGYLYAGGGKLCCGSSERGAFRLDVSAASRLIADRSQNVCGLPLLRTYWYDAARDGIPTSEHQKVAALPSVKLRLGRTDIRGRQKGVDALIFRDLMTLARERAISDAFLLAGDEDLREGVKSAQDMGVRVALIGVAVADGGWNQSRELVNEADERITLTKEDLSVLFECLSSDGSAPEPSGGQAAGSSSGHVENRTSEEAHQNNLDLMPLVQTAAAKIAGEWVDNATPGDVASVLQGKPRLPADLDSTLLSSLEPTAGKRLYEPECEYLRRAARGAFLLRIQQWVSSKSEAEN